MVLSHRGSDFDLAAMFATRLLFLQMCCKLFLQRKSKNQSMCRFPGPLLGVLDQRETQSERPTAFFDLAWTMVRFACRA